MKEYKGFVILEVMIAVVITIYIITTILKKKSGVSTAPKTSDSSKNNGQIVSNIGTNGVVNQSIFPIKRGSTGNAVLYIQKALNLIADKRQYTFMINNVPKQKISEDGAFGLETEQALKQLYGIVYVSKFMAKEIATDTGNGYLVSVIQYLN